MRTDLVKRFIPILLCALGSVAGAAPIEVRFDAGKLWLHTRAAPASDVFKAVAEKTGVRFVINSELQPSPLTVDIEGVKLERALRGLVGEIPAAAGHTMRYERDIGGAPRLVEVAVYGAGKAPGGEGAAVYEASSRPSPPLMPTPNVKDQMARMAAAGVPRETAEKVISLSQEIQKGQATPKPGSYRPEDLSPESREQLHILLERGESMERAVQILLIKEKYQDVFGGLSAAGALNIPGVTHLDTSKDEWDDEAILMPLPPADQPAGGAPPAPAPHP